MVCFSKSVSYRKGLRVVHAVSAKVEHVLKEEDLAGAAAYTAATQLRCVWSASNRGQIIIDLIRDLQAGSQVARHLIHSVGFVKSE